MATRRSGFSIPSFVWPLGLMAGVIGLVWSQRDEHARPTGIGTTPAKQPLFQARVLDTVLDLRSEPRVSGGVIHVTLEPDAIVDVYELEIPSKDTAPEQKSREWWHVTDTVSKASGFVPAQNELGEPLLWRV